jgi:hypothetical protein
MTWATNAKKLITSLDQESNHLAAKGSGSDRIGGIAKV